MTQKIYECHLKVVNDGSKSWGRSAARGHDIGSRGRETGLRRGESQKKKRFGHALSMKKYGTGFERRTPRRKTSSKRKQNLQEKKTSEGVSRKIPPKERGA